MRYLFQLLLILILFISTSPKTSAQVGWAKSYDEAAVVTAERHASEIGRQILEQGGNAVDAAVAVQFALSVTLPRAGNIGGGGFMVLHMADGTTRALDFREQAPSGATNDMFIRNGEYQPDMSRRSILASGVPGVVDGMVRATERYGRLPLEAVIAPAIKLAREGYRLSWTQANDLYTHAESFKRDRSSLHYFTKSSGTPYHEGDLFVQEDLAETLERIARFGRSGFYSGQTAEMIIREMQQHGGRITYRDLRNYKSKWRDPVRAQFREYELNIMPPPSSGSIAIAQILQMIENYDLEQVGFNSPDYIHLLTEAMRRAFADRAHFLGDPDFVDIPSERLLSRSYNKERMKSYDPNSASDSDEIGHGTIPGFQYSESSETTHFSIVDKDGNAVAVTTTLNGSFGNKFSVDGAGFLLNNEMDDFTAEPGEPNMFGLIQGKANAIEPGKRMLSSMSPTIVTQDGKLRMVLGAAGGPRIITATLQNFLNMAIFGMNAQQAVNAPRFHHQWLPDQLSYEPFGITVDSKRLIERKGHQLATMDNIGRSHVIFVDEEGKRHGAADPRGDGNVAGY
ncbi:gamma-glutamyltransferase [Aliifodinibius sp. S!AR15-10]|uniref:gamma-glutamyltransferase n=1 Tax=Aliifodinibius sp. S!AR15-10 TaxID=2950437 RepID=UPI0028541FBF|nr:gamma-glutamyltransferase [Aliifodinibius sp. S!AR15-10]MDR8393227.1 gamma-glutamyltransferase [Aliifodinibius sp. S!AR15-10]